MKTLNESEIAKAYEGMHYDTKKLWKIAIGSGNTRAVVFSRRIIKSQGALIGITDEIFNKWWDDDIWFSVYIDFDEASETIERCSIQKDKEVRKDNGSFHFVKVNVTEQDLEIFQNVLNFITETKE
jgi:hypothetical protein